MRPLVIVSIDTLRRDYMTPEYMPALYDMGGMWLDNVVVGGSWTVPSHTCLLTGQGPWRHAWGGIPPNRTRTELDRPTLLAALQERGYNTAFWGADLLLNCRRRDEVWGGPGEAGQVADGQTEAILEFMWESRPYALLLHYWGAHAPYGIPKTTAVQVGLACRRSEVRQAVMGVYGEAVRQIDRQLVSILNQARLHDALVLVTTDHGEDFGEDHPFGEHHFNYLLMHPMAWRPEAILVRSLLLGAGQGHVDAQLRNYDLAPALWGLLFDGEEIPGADGETWLGVSRLVNRPAECWSTEWGTVIKTIRGEAGHVTQLRDQSPQAARWIWTPERGLMSTETDWQWEAVYMQAMEARGSAGPEAGDYTGVEMAAMMEQLRGWGYE